MSIQTIIHLAIYHLMSGKHRVHNENTNSQDDTTTGGRRGNKGERAVIEECDLPGERNNTQDVNILYT